MENQIDFVITWVDGNDQKWRLEKTKFGGNEKLTSSMDDRTERYRDWDQVRYWFRTVEQFAPWVRRIHFVTCGHLPKWLDTSNPKLNIVRHEDYIPKEFLPTFNSNVIEANFHRIEDLSEQFVYFNDDMLLLQPVKKEDFFKNGKIVDMLALQPDVANVDNDVMPYIYMNNAMLLAKYFDKRENMKKQPGAYFHIGYPVKYALYNLCEASFPKFTGFYTVHGPAPLKKETYREIWSLEKDYLEDFCKNRFRTKKDVSQYVFREYEKLKGNFVPKNVHSFCGYYEIANDNTRLIKTIKRRNKKFLCMNDTNHEIDFEKAKAEILHALEETFPNKSSFEL